MAGKPIPISTANTMVTNYVNHVRQLAVDPNKKTQYVSFTLSELMQWLSQVTPFTDEIRICLGIHPDGSGDPGRVTAIIWPYKGGSPATKPFSDGKDGGGDEDGVDPFNDGSNGP